MELFARKQLEPAIREGIDRAKAGGEAGAPEAGQKVAPTAPEPGAVSRRPRSNAAKKYGIAAAGLGLAGAGDLAGAGQAQAAESGDSKMPNSGDDNPAVRNREQQDQ
jgi:hypothetical protein